MNELTPDAQDPRDDQINLLDLLAVLLDYRRMILCCLLAAVLGGALLYRLLPAKYVAESLVLMVPDPTESPLSGAAVPGVVALLGRSGGGGHNQALVGSILASQSLQDSLVRRVALQLRSADSAEIRRTIHNRMTVRQREDGNSYLVHVEAEQPRQAAVIANAVAGAANAIATRVSISQAVSKTALLEEQLAMARSDLEASERRLVAFQQQKAAPALPEQAKSTLQAAAELQQKIFEKQIAISSLRRTATQDNPTLQSALAELAAMRDQLRRVTSGDDAGQVFVPMNKAAELNVEASRVLRDYAKSEKVYTALLGALADAQLSVQDDLPVLTPLDVAAVPETPSGPNALRILVIAAFFGLSTGVVLAFILEYLRAARADRRNDRFFSTANSMRIRVLGNRSGSRSGRKSKNGVPT